MADALVGRVIDGRYRIISHLADGGMASVYVAMDSRLDRHVALKVMRPGLAGDVVFVDRFRSEARSAARLSHPNVVAVYDQGEDGGDVFLAMELVEGKTLREVIHEEAPLTPRESLAILEPILAALGAAHAAGIVHRDVKPENVIVRRDGEVKVADFGLARAVTNQAATSQSGVVLGTVSYLSPEQVERGVADHRSDLYATGLLLFEMLTGRKAVTGETPIQIAYRHVHGGVPAPSSVLPWVPADLDELVAHATAADPDARFQSAAQFVSALRSVRRNLSAAELDQRGPAPTDRITYGATALVPSFPPAPSPSAPAPEDAGILDGWFDEAALAPAEATPPPPGRSPAVVERTTAMPLAAPGSSRSDRAAVRAPARRRSFGWLGLLALLVAGVATGWWFTAGPGGTTTVPGVVTARVDDARAALDTASLDASTEEAFSEKVPAGVVISATPAPGTEVSKGSEILLVVSKGPERYTVPRLVGQPAAGIEETLAPLTLTLAPVRREWSEKVPEGVVVSQEPAPGESVKRGTEVQVVVSKGRQPIKVPDLRNKPFPEAKRLLTQAGLEVERTPDVNSDTVPAGKVVSHDPGQGTTLHRGDVVRVTVSKGPVLVKVPKVIGKPLSQAQPELVALGFDVKVERPLGTFFELVRRQSIAADTMAPKGSTIVLIVV